MKRSRSKVFWLQCYQIKSNGGGVNLINPKDALTALLVKWIMEALEPGSSNLHLLPGYWLEHFQPYNDGRWEPSLEYFILPKFQAKPGSKVSNRVGTSWRSLVKDISRVRP
jgi:hypothetical protein